MVEIVPLYPPLMKVPPAAMKSVKGPPLTEISNTAPSRPFSKSKLFSKIKLAPMGKIKAGVSRFESVTQPGSLWNALLGADEGLVALVVHCVPSAQVPPGVQLAGPGVKEDDQPAGSAGGVTVSKSSSKEMIAHGTGVGVTAGVAVGLGVGVEVTGTIA